MAEPKFTDDGKIADIARRITAAEKELQTAKDALDSARRTESGASCKLSNLKSEFTKATCGLIDRNTLEQISPPRVPQAAG
jgi:hypothetical protein